MEDEEDILEEALADISPDREEFINRRINHINFARTIFWLCVKSRKEDYVHARPLSEFLKVSMQRALNILGDLAMAGILRKKYPTSNLTEFWFIIEKGNPVIQEYFERAKKTLGVKIKIRLEQKES